MPKRSLPARRTELPSKAQILAMMAAEAAAAATTEAEVVAATVGPMGRLGKREIARAFGLKGEAKLGLKRLLRELEAEGAIERRGKALRQAGRLPAMLVCDIVGRDADGELLARPSDWDGPEHGACPRIIVDPHKAQGVAQAAAGVGDRVLLRLAATDSESDTPVFRADVVKILAKTEPRQLGVLRLDPKGGARVMPVDKRAAATEFIVPEAERGGAEDGELVAIEPIGRPRSFGLQTVRVVGRLGSTRSERAVSMIAILTHGIPHVFRPATLAEAAATAPASLAGREDWRRLPLVTIDPPDAKDHDDAVHAAPDADPGNPGGFIVSVAIADVACLVAPGSAMDREALERGNSVYFPDRVVPMLPERISTDLGSLRPGEDRPALAVRLVLGQDGRKHSHSFHRVMIRSIAKLHYAQVQTAIDGAPDEATAPLLPTVLEPLYAAYRAAARGRDARAPLDLDLPERKLVLDPEGHVARVVAPTRLDAHRLIEEFMILANVAAAETLEHKRQRLVYRVHDAPSATKLNALQEFLGTLGIKLAKGQVLRPAQFNGILARVRGGPHDYLVNDVVLRAQAQAEYAVDNDGHFGLNLPRYAHFTSPIRRYADLIVHRALIRALDLGPDGLPDYDAKTLGEMAAQISATERRAMAAERETIDRLIAGFLAERVDEIFEARISGVTKAGLFVKLAETGADGFVPAALLGDEYFSFDDPGRALVGTRSGTRHRLGDAVSVRLVEAAPLAGALRFEVVGSRAPGPGGRGTLGRPPGFGPRRKGPGKPGPAKLGRASRGR